MRNIDCKNYLNCLDKAARNNSHMECEGCGKNSLNPSGLNVDFKIEDKKQKILIQKPTEPSKNRIVEYIEVMLNSNKNPAAVMLGRLGGLKGGPARAKKLSKEERVRIAKRAANTRWGNRDSL